VSTGKTLDNSLRILDEDGKLYVWDDSRKDQVGTVFSNSFKTNGIDLELMNKCKTKFDQMGRPDNFEIDIAD